MRLIIAIFAGIIFFGLIFVHFFTPLSIFPAVDGDNPPKFIQADFVELDKIYTVSKFRSGVGHDYSVHSGETCRSMKHYFSSMDPDKPNYKMELKKAAWPMPVEGEDVTIFSPVDGKILKVDINKKVAMGYDIFIIPDSQPKILIRLMHVAPIGGMKGGVKVKAGQKVGLVHANQSFDIAIDQIALTKTTYISYFAAMPDQVFARYQARGIKSRDELILSKEYRDANPLKCQKNSEEFMENYADYPNELEHMVHLSGYDTIDTKIQAQWDEYKKSSNK